MRASYMTLEDIDRMERTGAVLIAVARLDPDESWTWTDIMRAYWRALGMDDTMAIAGTAVHGRFMVGKRNRAVACTTNVADACVVLGSLLVGEPPAELSAWASVLLAEGVVEVIDDGRTG